ncbi:hypothetical protein L204_101635 [Cryptococcus depauperatus]|nr:hypothetical protein L204_04401 [Cryptococcus depauperatus CBS 7855]
MTLGRIKERWRRVIVFRNEKKSGSTDRPRNNWSCEKVRDSRRSDLSKAVGTVATRVEMVTSTRIVWTRMLKEKNGGNNRGGERRPYVEGLDEGLQRGRCVANVYARLRDAGG